MTNRLLILDLAEGRAFSVKPDGSDKRIIATGGRMPSRNDGSIERVDLDGRNRKAIVPEGATFTPKQLQLDKRHGKLYCDREGMRVMRANLQLAKGENEQLVALLALREQRK